MKTILTFGALALALTSMQTFAADAGNAKKGEGKRDPEAMFKRLDTNNDGSISKEEWDASPMAKKDADKAAKSFTARDKDKDGKITKEEFTAAPKGKGKGNK
jgi:Ca2+-binding EF-hand superfamily protein